MSDNNLQICSCKWKSCKRHGDCEKCIEHHKVHPKYSVPFCKKTVAVKKPAMAVN